MFKAFFKLLCFLTVIISGALLLVDWQNYFEPKIHTPPRGTQITCSAQRDTIQKTYDSAVSEIKMRLEQESTLFTYKFTLVGAILSVLIGNSFFSKKDAEGLRTLNNSNFMFFFVIFFWAAIDTSAIIDSRICFHQNIIQSLGTWIHREVEPAMLPPGFSGWEDFLSKSNLINSKFYPLLRFNTTLLTFLLFLPAVMVSKNYIRYSTNQNPRRDKISDFCFFGTSSALILFFISSLHFQYDRSPWCIYTNIGVLIFGLLGTWVLWGERVEKTWNNWKHFGTDQSI